MKTFLIVIACLLGVAGIGFAIYTLISKKNEKEDQKEDPVVPPVVPVDDDNSQDPYVPVSLTLSPVNRKCEPPVPEGMFCTKTYVIIASVKGGMPISDVIWIINGMVQSSKALELRVDEGSTGFPRDATISCKVTDGKSEDAKAVKIL